MAETSNILVIEVDAALATNYRIAYEQALGKGDFSNQSLAAFIAQFVNDRLVEELQFVQVDYPREN